MAKVASKGWSPDYGYLVVLYADEYRVNHHMPPGTLIDEAREYARQRLRADTRFYKSWIITKTKPGVTP